MYFSKMIPKCEIMANLKVETLTARDVTVWNSLIIQDFKIGSTVVDDAKITELLGIVYENKKLKQELKELKDRTQCLEDRAKYLEDEFKAIKAQLANRSTDLGELEDVCKKLEESIANTPKIKELKELVGMDVDRAVKLIERDFTGAMVVKVGPGGFVFRDRVSRRLHLFYNGKNKVCRVPEFG